MGDPPGPEHFGRHGLAGLLQGQPAQVMRINGQILMAGPDDFPAVLPDLDLAEKGRVPKRSENRRRDDQVVKVHAIHAPVVPGHGHGMRSIGGPNRHDALDAVLHSRSPLSRSQAAWMAALFSAAQRMAPSYPRAWAEPAMIFREAISTASAYPGPCVKMRGRMIPGINRDPQIAGPVNRSHERYLVHLVHYDKSRACLRQNKRARRKQP